MSPKYCISRWLGCDHWSNETTMKRYIEKVIVPFVIEKRQKLKLDPGSPATAIFDNFHGQTTDVILSLLRSHNIVPIQLPANCTDKLQPLDISVNKPMKDHLKSKFQQWYAQEVKKQLETVPFGQVKVDVGLQVIKSPSANWIISGWKKSRSRSQWIQESRNLRCHQLVVLVDFLLLCVGTIINN